MDIFKKKLQEKSTYAGLGVIGTVLGLFIAPDHLEIFGAAILGIIGVIEVFRGEN